MPEQYAIGLDVGGTKILGGVVDNETGKIEYTVKMPSPTGGGDGVVAAIEETIQKLLDEAPHDVIGNIKRIGVGVAGQVNKKTGILLSAPNLGGGVKNVDVAGPLRERFKLPIMLGNDVEVAAIGEGKFGAGRNIALFACVFVGTGIGGALVQDGKRYEGATGSAGEIGHTMILAGGRICGCGQAGHLEAYSSRTAIVNILREEVTAGGKTSLSAMLFDSTQRVKSKPLSQAVDAGDPLVISVMTQSAHYLGLGLASLINLWNPQRIILGGGVVDRMDLLFRVASETAKATALQVPASGVEIVRAELGDYSGTVGAAVLED